MLSTNIGASHRAFQTRWSPMPFTDEKAACMVVSDEAFVMPLTEPFFTTFTHRRLCNTANVTEGLFAVSCRSKTEVDEMVETAIAAGGKHAMEKQKFGFMHGRSFLRPRRPSLGGHLDGF